MIIIYAQKKRATKDKSDEKSQWYAVRRETVERRRGFICREHKDTEASQLSDSEV